MRGDLYATREYLLSGAARRDQDDALRSLSRESTSLHKSEQMVDEMMRQGAETVQQLHGQRSTLKGAQRKMMVRYAT
jgi:prefoldin subunit 5